MKKTIYRSMMAMLTLLLCLACVLVAIATVAAEEDDGDVTYVQPGYVVDLTTQDSLDSYMELYHVSVSNEDGAMRLTFDDTGNGECFDPYMSLPLDSKTVDCAEYPYLAILIKTDLQSKNGQIRFRTTATGNEYPCQVFSYAQTDDWQLVICKLTDLNTVLFYPTGNGAFTGTYTNIRLDMFDNECPSDTYVAIKAYAFYRTAEDAATFVNYQPPASGDEDDGILDSVDYASFWKGEAFATPALDKRMRWVTSGYSNNTASIDRFLGWGYGGFVSNVAFNQDYLRDEAEFASLKSIFDYTNSLGMNTWIYDEYQWPSGKAFGLVLEGHDEYEATGIEHKTLSGNGGTAAYTLSGEDLRVMQAVLTDENGTRDVTVNDDGTVATEATGTWMMDVYVLRHTFEGEEDPTNWEMLRDVDLLNKGSVQRFIEVTYQKYKDELGDTFDAVQGFFTDEPQLGNRAMTSYAVWTEGLDERFLETYGYELNLPSLFAGNTDYDRTIRMNYYQLVATMFKESYVDQITDWCEANGTASSGHFLFEENMNDHIETYGGDFMQIVGGMTIPGADALWVDPEHLMGQNNIGNYMGLRYVFSAAKNAGKNDVMIEYNPDATGSLPSEPLDVSIGGAAISRLLGTNIYHVINPQYSYSTSEINKLNTYVGRLNTLLDDAIDCGELAVFYPIATVQALHNADADHSSTSGQSTMAVQLNAKYELLCKNLLLSQHLYTIIDDQSICDATVAKGGYLCIGNGAYHAVVLPYTQYISVEALEKLVLFCEAGGTVIFVGDKPEHGLLLDEEDEIAALMAELDDQPFTTNISTTLKNLVDPLVHRNISVDTTTTTIRKNMLMGDFESDDRDITFLVNIREADSEVTISYTDGYEGNATIYYPSTGLIETVTLGAGTQITVPGYDGILIMREDDNTRIFTEYVPAETIPETDAVTAPVTESATELATEPANPPTTTEGFQTTEPDVTTGPADSAANVADVPESIPATAVALEEGCGSAIGGTATVLMIFMTLVACVAALFGKRRRENT